MKLLNSIRGEIRGLNHYAEGKMPLKSKVNKCLKLSSNENLIGTSPLVAKAIEVELKKGLTIYPDSGMKLLKSAVIDFWKRHSIKLKPGELLFGDASGEVLNMILSAFVSQGDTVIIPEKSFILYALLSAPKGADVIETKRNNFRADPEEIIKAVKISKNPKIIILANPDNPTSTFLDSSEIERILKNTPEEIAVLIDEAYIHYAGIDSSIIKFKDKYPNLIISFTFSKVYGLAGLRAGYAVMNEMIAEQIEKIRLPFNLGSLQQAGAAAAIKDDDFVKQTVEIINYGRKYLEKEMDSLRIWHLKSYGNFIFADFGDRCTKIIEKLEENGISVRTLGAFGFGDNYVRITIGRPDDNEYLIEKLREAVK